MSFDDPAVWLPMVFACLMGLSILIYVVLDGFDLGVGILFPLASRAEQDRMIGSIGPFWDANETWLVLAVGLLLVAFPVAHGLILSTLYLPVAVLLIGLILRGVAFEFRAKSDYKGAWNGAFFVGSLMASLSQGFMLGLYVMGLNQDAASLAFAALTAVCLTLGYAFIGAAWLIIKAEDALQAKAVRWARVGLIGVIIGVAAVSITSPMVSARIFDKWFSVPEILLLAPLPILSVLVAAIAWVALKNLPNAGDRWTWIPFASAGTLFALAFAGLAYSFYPYVVPDQLTIYEAAAAPESLFVILIGTLCVLPIILGYTVLAYTVFRGKATNLTYG